MTNSESRTATAAPDYWHGHLAVEINNTYELGLTEKGMRWLINTIARRANAAGALDRSRSRSMATTRHPESRRDGLQKAAPDMLAALRGTLILIDAMSAKAPPDMQPGFAMWRQEITAAISKATGAAS